MSSPGSSDTSSPAVEVFDADRLHLMGLAATFGMILMITPAKPLILGWLLFVPIIAGAYLWRSRTTVDSEGITARRGFSAPVHVSWEDFAGIRFSGSGAFATTAEGVDVRLPGVTFNSLPRLEKASQGRIPDALTQGHQAAEDKVVIIHRDGRQVLVDKDDPAAQVGQASYAEPSQQ